MRTPSLTSEEIAVQRVKRAYALGLKAVPNFTALSEEQLAYFEMHLDELPSAIARGFVISEPAAAPTTAVPETPKVYLRRLYETETITVGATDGTESLPGLSASGHATEAATVIVDEQTVNGKFAELFGSKGPTRRRWSRSQVAKFATDNPSKLRGDGYGNFFELEDSSVASVGVFDGGQPDADVYEFSGDVVWDAGDRHRFFSLQQVA